MLALLIMIYVEIELFGVRSEPILLLYGFQDAKKNLCLPAYGCTIQMPGYQTVNIIVRLGPSPKLKLEERRFGPKKNTKFLNSHSTTTTDPPTTTTHFSTISRVQLKFSTYALY